MSKKHVLYLAGYAIVMLLLTVLVTMLQFNLIGNTMPILNWKYSAFEAYTTIAFAWLLLPIDYLLMADSLKALQELDGLETSDE